MKTHTEQKFEDEIVEYLTAHGWHLGHSAGYSRALALYLPDVEAWLKQTQPDQWAKIEKTQGANTLQVLAARLAQSLDQNGPLHVLRNGFKHINAQFAMCQWQPENNFNPTTLERFAQVRCTVMRQVHYSRHHENSIDLVFFVNGIPTATLELKTDFTQTVQDAIRQYKHDRLPRDPKANADEPLLAFNQRCLVHFATSSHEVHMTTRLEGPKTRFLPFNQGHDEGAGNPPNPNGYATSYLWEQVLARETWLDILRRFAHSESKTTTDAKGKSTTRHSLIFPRYHQWQAVTQLVEAARREGAGHNYLIQHSAGSGKSNSIAWLAHRLASLHDAQGAARVFDSVIVVTDRNVLDSQLQETIFQFDHKSGVVVGISEKGGSKSSQLATALANNTPIIIVTLQTFPFVLEAIQQQSSFKTRRFAVIADEAHSSQSGAAASGLAQVLASETNADGTPPSVEDVMLAAQEERAEHRNVSYFAFTATPKPRTLERFGRVPDPAQPPSDTNAPAAFHVYSMRQAIEEEFILDVLENFTPYKLAFKLAYGGQDYDDDQVDQSRALKSLMRWVRLHPHNITQKVQIIVEHFRSNVAALLDGRAKAMVVTDSRQAAVRYKLAIDKYIKEQGYTLGTLVAFSGEVNDSESGPQAFSESNMNLNLKGRDIRTAFSSDEFQILLVANKFQTGFDQPLLCAMYVDKRLDGITAVQTLSRLNRIYPGKETTYILDFVNEPTEILKAFLPYYKTAQLSGVSDPNQIHTLQNKLDLTQIYTDSEVEQLAEVFSAPPTKQAALQAAIAPAVNRFRTRWKAAQSAEDKKTLDELEIFRKDLATFVRMYDFLSQIINFGDTALESRNIFFRHLLPQLKTENLDEAIDLSKVQLSHYKLKDTGQRNLGLNGVTEQSLLDPASAAGSGVAYDPAKARLQEIIARMNDVFEGEVSEADALTFALGVRDKMLENTNLQQQAQHNTKEQFKLGDFGDVLIEAVMESLEKYQDKAGQVLSNNATRAAFANMMLDMVYESLQKKDVGMKG